jgi:CRISPR-associated protein Cas2
MTARYIVTYDISDDERRTAVFKALRGYGEHLQFSVFRCDLTSLARTKMVARLHGLIDQSVDQILLIDLGPVEGRAASCIDAIGRKYMPAERIVTVI